ncbi:polysaccharide pyruvyl transferase family protein [Sandarakinorhabdus rubra]|uniref:polysaccharide pyruvyl transferase family protein n=1 Tax=Sandarakinorhabdus rubra TaxID=2672568 RepID=UPI0013DB69CD|nr:polysaccharide pyruvyl transferase family protein [Sandarakinorhabdus rubra]
MRDIRIGLLWHAGQATNLGVGALSAGNLLIARQAAAQAGLSPRFTIIGPQEHGPDSINDSGIETRIINGRYMASPRGYRADLKRLDIMLDICGGDSFTDIYANKRFAYVAATKILPILSGVPLVLSPQTIGPFSKQPHSAVAGWICRQAHAIFVRDALSLTALAAIAPGVPARQVVDVAFALPYTPRARTPGRLQVGLNVSGLLMQPGNQFGLGIDYPALTHRLIEALLERKDCDVHLLAHVLAPHVPADDDGRSIDLLKAAYPALHRAPDFVSASDAKSFISGLDFLVGGRMHATIAAFSAGVPVVPISYSRKFEGLFGGLGYEWLVTREMNNDAALALVLRALDQREQVAADIAAAAPVIDAGLRDYRDALATLFADAAP